MEASGNTKSVTPLGAHARQMYQLMCERGFEGRDFSSVFKFIEKKQINKQRLRIHTLQHRKPLAKLYITNFNINFMKYDI